MLKLTPDIMRALDLSVGDLVYCTLSGKGISIQKYDAHR